MRRQGADAFHVWPQEPRRGFYTAIVFLEPLDLRNQAALGYDMFSDATRRAAMEAARDSGSAVASGKVTLVQEIDPGQQQAGFLIYLPVYRRGPRPPTVEDRVAALEGFVSHRSAPATCSARCCAATRSACSRCDLRR